MKNLVILLFAFCYVQCRKTYPPIDKNANLAFINMEGGGGTRPGSQPQTLPARAPSPPASPPAKAPVAPVNPPVTAKPAVVSTPKPVSPTPAVPKPAAPSSPKVVPQTPNQIKPVPVNPAPVANPVSTPGPGSVKQLVNFYDSQGKGSPIRPFSYSQAVKQG